MKYPPFINICVSFQDEHCKRILITGNYATHIVWEKIPVKDHNIFQTFFLFWEVEGQPLIKKKKKRQFITLWLHLKETKC